MKKQAEVKTEHSSEKEARKSREVKLKKLKFEVGQEMGINLQENYKNS